jgi:hypothetical protein
VLDPQVAGEAEQRDRQNDDAGQEVTQQDHPTARDAVDDRAGEEEEHELYGRADRCSDAQLDRRRAEREQLKRHGDLMEKVPEDRHRLSGPEEPEVTVPQRVEDEWELHSRSAMVRGSGDRSRSTRVGDETSASP